MKWYHQALIALFVICLAGGLIYSANHYHSKYEAEKKRADDAVSLAELRLDTINDMQVRQRDVAALDAKYTGELEDAKKDLADLQRCVATGKCGLRLKASCPASGATTPGSLGDASSPRLDDSAERDYWSLRSGIATITKQVSYLQDYIRQQCLN